MCGVRGHLGPQRLSSAHACKCHGEIWRQDGKEAGPVSACCWSPSAAKWFSRQAKRRQKGLQQGDVPEELSLVCKAKCKGRLTKQNVWQEKKTGKWCVITQLSLGDVLGGCRLLQKQRGQMAAPLQSRAVCREGAKFLPKSQFQTGELPVKGAWQHSGCSQPQYQASGQGILSAPPQLSLLCAFEAIFLVVLNPNC